MEFHLVLISGKESRGTCWTIDEHGLLLGRDKACDVVLFDAAVSRRHCRLWVEDGRVMAEDLASRNPALVDGKPMRAGPLKIGNELALGHDQFIVSAGKAFPRARFTGSAALPTVSWDKAGMLSMDVDSTRAGTQNHPRTLQDLALLHEITCELSAAGSTDALVERLSQRIQQRFQPLKFWWADIHEHEVRLRETPPWSSAEDAPRPAIDRALRDRKGMLTPLRRRANGNTRVVFLMVCPVILADNTLAVLALETMPPHGCYDDADLTLLILLAQALAPSLYALGHIEQLQRDNVLLRGFSGESARLIGDSRGIKHVRQLTSSAARSDLNVLIVGETGTGKELVARNIHALSTRKNRPLIVVNSAAIPRELFESELFGHEKGAFTGAVESSDGLLFQADGGVLFLDEIGDLSLENQARILRAIDHGSFRRLGGKEDIQVDVRVIAATNKDISEAVRTGEFRRDLYHRLNGFEIRIPALRERRSDIPVLAKHFLELAEARSHTGKRGFSSEVLEHLQACPWPGNVRELRNRVQRAVDSGHGEFIQLKEVLDDHENKLEEARTSNLLSLRAAEQRHIQEVLHRLDGNIREAARVLGIGRSTLYAKIADYESSL